MRDLIRHLAYKELTPVGISTIARRDFSYCSGERIIYVVQSGRKDLSCHRPTLDLGHINRERKKNDSAWAKQRGMNLVLAFYTTDYKFIVHVTM